MKLCVVKYFNIWSDKVTCDKITKDLVEVNRKTVRPYCVIDSKKHSTSTLDTKKHKTY